MPDQAALEAMRARVTKLLPPIVVKNQSTIPNLTQLERNYRGDPLNGKKVFNLEDGPKCGGCHSLGGPKKVGPDLSAIGNKMGKQGLIDAIVTPSVAIAPEYYVWVLDTKTRGQVIGILAEDSPDRVVVKTDAKEEVRLKPSEIIGRRQSKLSMMPEDLLTTMTMQQFADLLEYLTTLKDEKMAAKR
jgi:putative heme-binding domain-containing protein